MLVLHWFLFIVFSIWSVLSFVRYKEYEVSNLTVGLLTLSIARLNKKESHF